MHAKHELTKFSRFAKNRPINQENDAIFHLCKSNFGRVFLFLIDHQNQVRTVRNGPAWLWSNNKQCRRTIDFFRGGLGRYMGGKIDFRQWNDCLERCECVIYTVVYYFNDAINMKASGNILLTRHTYCKSFKINNIKRACRTKIRTWLQGTELRELLFIACAYQ